MNWMRGLGFVKHCKYGAVIPQPDVTIGDITLNADIIPTEEEKRQLMACNGVIEALNDEGALKSFTENYELARGVLKDSMSMEEVKLKLDLNGKKFSDIYAASWGIESGRLKTPNMDQARFIERNRAAILDLFKEYCVNLPAEIDKTRLAIDPDERHVEDVY